MGWGGEQRMLRRGRGVDEKIGVGERKCVEECAVQYKLNKTQSKVKFSYFFHSINSLAVECLSDGSPKHARAQHK